MSNRIKLFMNYVSHFNEQYLKVQKSVLDIRSSISDDDDMVFYLDYHPNLEFQDSVDKLPNNAIDYIRKHKSKILIYTEGFDLFGQLPEIFEHHIDVNNVPYWKILKTLERKGINEDQLHIWTANYGYDQEIEMLATRKIKWLDSTYNVKARFLYLNDMINIYSVPNKKTKDPNKIKFLFSSLANGRPSLHRYNFTKKILQLGLQQHGKISMTEMVGPDKEFNKKLPIIYDGKHNQWGSEDESHLFDDTLIWISNETFLNQRNIKGYTEKTIKAIYYKSPFMINGCAGLLELLQHDGFMTFNQIWDESYDMMDDIDDRQNHILSLLQKLKDMDHRDLYEKTLAITKHNHDHLMSLSSAEKLHDFLSE